MLTLQDVVYAHPNKDLLFDGLSLIVNKHDKIALVGNNGTGKSTLLQILAGRLSPTGGQIQVQDQPYLVPQVFGQFNQYSVAEALGIAQKLEALQQILAGEATEENLNLLDNDWVLEERCQMALARWGLNDIALTQKMEMLSGGQKTKVFLSGIEVHRPELVLLDEPSNHLDAKSRNLLYEYIQSTKNALVVVSHDRALLKLLHTVCELNKHGLVVYGGNYDFYAEQKDLASNAFAQDVKNKEKALRKAKETEREAIERQQKLDARGKKKQEKAGLPTIVMNTLKNSAERSTAQMKGIHAEKVGAMRQELQQLRQNQPQTDKMKLDLDHAGLHKGKMLLKAQSVNLNRNCRWLWKEPINLQLNSGDRMAIKGNNGSGKTTLIKLVLGELQPEQGTLERTPIKAIYIDQDYSLINNELSVYEQAQHFNTGMLQEHEVKIRLNRFLFGKDDWDKPCLALSGGEKMRLMLCTLTIAHQAPDLIVLDEPTNNLDLQNIDILTTAINEYKGSLLVVSHDEYFLEQVNIVESILLER
ncbi:ABC-F family ATP-binding cassette domain-containing protein [Pedobacter sp. ASV12]|uniref:ABC-F family ATP-binding cassette domain-containing protein n=1 Tax=Pedobacter sp. ASV12 TaxID=2795120 RepID=UPI0018EC1F23|nr:ABC-F family ATP-binding cassette domain-containing protein [Pedobacter sp. ASV12]